MPFKFPHRNFFEDLGLVEVLEEVRRLPKERTYLKRKHYLRKNLDFKISKTKPITKEPSLVFMINGTDIGDIYATSGSYMAYI